MLYYIYFYTLYILYIYIIQRTSILVSARCSWSGDVSFAGLHVLRWFNNCLLAQKKIGVARYDACDALQLLLGKKDGPCTRCEYIDASSPFAAQGLQKVARHGLFSGGLWCLDTGPNRTW